MSRWHVSRFSLTQCSEQVKTYLRVNREEVIVKCLVMFQAQKDSIFQGINPPQVSPILCGTAAIDIRNNSVGVWDQKLEFAPVPLIKGQNFQQEE